MRAALLLIALFGCQKSDATPTPSPGSAVAPAPAAGPPQAYLQLCSQCHGKDLKGYAADHAPSLINETFLASATDGYIYNSIANGRPGTAMAAYGKAKNGPLADRAITEIVAYLRTFGAQPRPTIAHPPGDAVKGAVAYAKNCQSCHGNADVRGEAPMLANVEFQKLATDEFMRYAIEEGRPGTKMLAWKSLMSTDEISDVIAAIRVLDKAGKPVEGQLPAPTGKEPLVINPGGAQPKFTLHGDPCPDGTKCPQDRYVPADQVEAALKAKQKMIIIDARPESEWMRVHVTGAVSIPHHAPKRLDEIPNDGTWVIAYCACPHHLSGEIVDMLRKKGIKHAVVLDEGILEWHRRGYPVLAGPNVLPPPKEMAQPNAPTLR